MELPNVTMVDQNFNKSNNVLRKLFWDFLEKPDLEKVFICPSWDSNDFNKQKWFWHFSQKWKFQFFNNNDGLEFKIGIPVFGCFKIWEKVLKLLKHIW